MSRHYNGANAAKGANVTGPARVALYARVSADEQRKIGFNFADQRLRLQKHAEREGWEVAEEGLPGTNLYRSGLRRILELAQEGA